MRKHAVIVLLLALAACTGASPDAKSSVLGTKTSAAPVPRALFMPPFAKGVGIGSQKQSAPCRTGPSPARTLQPLPAKGRIDTGIGISGQSCRFATASTTYFLPIGDVSESVAGKPGTITSVIRIQELSFPSSGFDPRGAHVGFAVGKKYAPAERILGIDCAQSCSRSGQAANGGSGAVTFTRHFAAVPSSLWATVTADCSMRNATGSIGVELRATLVSVTIS